MDHWIKIAALCGLSSFCIGLGAFSLASYLDEKEHGAHRMAQEISYAYAQVAPWQPTAPVPALAHRQSVTIPLRSDNRALMVDAQLNQRFPMTFVLDTGATYTAISYETAIALGYDLKNCRRIAVTTANGYTEFPVITLSEINVNGYRVHNIEATVMPLPKNAPFSGLLGLSFIRQHKMTIDPVQGSMTLEPS